MSKILLAGSLLLALAACSRTEAPAIPAPKIEGEQISFATDSPQLKGLITAAAEVRDSDTLRINGRLVWDESRTVRIFAPLAGRIERLIAQPGQAVKAGEALALVSSPDFGQAQAEARRADADYGVADQSLKRSRELAAQGVLAGKDLQAAEADFARAAAERERTRARAALYGGHSGVDQKLPLKSPITGTVVERNANPGQEVRPDQAQPGSPALFVVSDPAHLWVQLELGEAALPHIRPGMSFTLRGAGIAADGASGKVEWIADNLDPATRTTRARGSVANPERRLKAEMFVTAELEVHEGRHLRVPATAVILLGDTQYVFVETSPGSFARRKVVAEEAGIGHMRIVSGLEANERVVTDGALLLQQLLSLKTK